MTYGRIHYDRATGDSTTTALLNRRVGAWTQGQGDLGAHGRFHYNRVAGDSTYNRITEWGGVREGFLHWIYIRVKGHNGRASSAQCVPTSGDQSGDIGVRRPIRVVQVERESSIRVITRLSQLLILLYVGSFLMIGIGLDLTEEHYLFPVQVRWVG